MTTKQEGVDREYLLAAARAVQSQAVDNPSIGIPVDPDVAEFMGAFEETAIGLDDLDELQEGVEGGHGA